MTTAPSRPALRLAIAPGVDLAAAIDAFLSQPDLAPTTRAKYRQTLAVVEDELGDAPVTGAGLAGVVAQRWHHASPATWKPPRRDRQIVCVLLLAHPHPRDRRRRRVAPAGRARAAGPLPRVARGGAIGLAERLQVRQLAGDVLDRRVVARRDYHPPSGQRGLRRVERYGRRDVYLSTRVYVACVPAEAMARWLQTAFAADVRFQQSMAPRGDTCRALFDVDRDGWPLPGSRVVAPLLDFALAVRRATEETGVSDAALRQAIADCLRLTESLNEFFEEHAHLRPEDVGPYRHTRTIAEALATTRPKLGWRNTAGDVKKPTQRVRAQWVREGTEPEADLLASPDHAVRELAGARYGRCSRRARDTPRRGRSTRQTLAVVEDELGDTPVTGAGLAGVVAQRWHHASPATWNRHVATVGSFARYCSRTRVLEIAGDVELQRRAEKHDHTRSIALASLERLWERRDIELRERTLWRLLYETPAARADEVLRLNVEDVDIPGKCARTRSKGGDVDWLFFGWAVRGCCHA